MKKTKQLVIFGICIGLILVGVVLAFFTPVSYFAMFPGDAIDTHQYVKVATKQPNEKGKFLLTTVSLKRASVLDYLFSFTSHEMKLVPESDIKSQDESDKEYERRQEENMRESQNHAIISAYHQAKKPIKVEHVGIEVFELTQNAKSGLKEGDLIQELDHQSMKESVKLLQYLQNKKAGEQVEVKFTRKNKPMIRKIKLVSLPVPKGQKPRAGLGIVPVDRVKVTSDPPARIKTEEIGGPSAGLMFSLEVMDQLLPEDLTRGYTVAGTGTINEKGEVGQIGGIEFKVIAADRKGAQIFFCPKDQQSGDNNEKIAKEMAKRINTKMKIVPVSTLSEAVQYLRKQPTIALATKRSVA
ncbi:SepM family pheromone-processing serine protease [Thermoflavimicrobium daqui]|uniref:SepM family pheromone-processing serine protease n=1 Tax=Thermoflavimicrobium daqui TaxID=2137476 RepID=UPI00143DFC3D|nr:SepM family pheromone-processing serine protease [Thermoflavimicrobium daqui]